MAIEKEQLEKVVIKFAGDSGDGMQLTGMQFTGTSALLGNDLATFPDYPAEIRAPKGTVAGVSGFQVHIGQTDILTPGDNADVLVAMNAAALKANINFVLRGKTIIVDIDNCKKKDWEKAGFTSDPLQDGTLDGFNLIEAPITSLTKEALKDIGLDNKVMLRSKNMFALGMVYWMFSRPLEHTENFLNTKFEAKPLIAEANIKALRAGYNYAETIEALTSVYTVLPADLKKGTYKNVMGNQATAWGFLAAAAKANLELYLGSYPITPASEILHELAKYKHFGAKAFQAEDEIAGVVSAIGASFAGDLAITTTSGPGLALKGEGIGLAIIAELPLVIVNVQRGGPSTGLPTKTEQSDLFQALYGRNGASPAIVIAASTPANCFDYAYLASKIALEHMTPVILLTDGYLGNGSQPWKVKTMDELPDIKPNFVPESKKETWLPYERDPKTKARYWAFPGQKGMEHRIGGLEKHELTGNISYDPINHENMVRVREEKVDLVANSIPELNVEGSQEGDLLIVGWGGTYGSLLSAVRQLNLIGVNLGLAHFNYIKPLPRNTTEVFGRFKNILVCELNDGQFLKYLRGVEPKFKFDGYNKVQGMPFTVAELTQLFTKKLGEIKQ
jgi:2-oxoglutarate ferredoxin oxidoreductase subunit alpha